MSSAAVLAEAATAIGMVLLGIVVAGLGAILIGMALRLFFVNRDEVTKNASRSQNIRAFLTGQLSSRADPIPDMRIKEGMKYSEKDKAVIAQGGLSHEAIRRGFNWRS
ncbi:MAG: hypothetical protein ACK4Y5_19780 [Acetobacteraceae bacterium]|jgi:hypothetical protein